MTLHARVSTGSVTGEPGFEVGTPDTGHLQKVFKKRRFFAGSAWLPPRVCLRVLICGETLRQCFYARKQCRSANMDTL